MQLRLRGQLVSQSGGSCPRCNLCGSCRQVRRQSHPEMGLGGRLREIPLSCSAVLVHELPPRVRLAVGEIDPELGMVLDPARLALSQ